MWFLEKKNNTVFQGSFPIRTRETGWVHYSCSKISCVFLYIRHTVGMSPYGLKNLGKPLSDRKFSWCSELPRSSTRRLHLTHRPHTSSTDLSKRLVNLRNKLGCSLSWWNTVCCYHPSVNWLVSKVSRQMKALAQIFVTQRTKGWYRFYINSSYKLTKGKTERVIITTRQKMSSRQNSKDNQQFPKWHLYCLVAIEMDNHVRHLKRISELLKVTMRGKDTYTVVGVGRCVEYES